MTSKCRLRARNSLSYQKFVNRLNKGLPVFTVHGEEKNGGIQRYDNCRNLYWHAWRYPRGTTDGAYFIDITHHYPTWTYEDNVSLEDMNVWRNKYNKNFAFRTQWAAEQYARDIGIMSIPAPVVKPSFLEKLVDKIKIRAKI